MFDEIEEGFNENLEKMEEKKDSLLVKAKTFFKDKKNIVIVILSVLLLSYIVWTSQVQGNPIIKEIIKTETVDKQFKLKDGVFCANLNEYEVTKFAPRNIKDAEGKILAEKFRTWYRKTSKDSINDSKFYITIEENINKLKHNKKSYSNYLDDEAKNAKKQ